MKKSKLTAMILCFILTGTVYADVPQGAFIMKPKSNKAYFYNGTTTESISFYKDRKSGCPYIGADGNAYISAKYFFEAFGSGNEYVREGDNLVIKTNGKKCTVPIGKKFAVRNREYEGNMYVYSIEDDYYIPAKLVAMLCGGRVDYDEETGQILLITESSVENDVFSDDFMSKQVPYTYMNNAVKNNTYLACDGKSIEAVSDAQSVFRLGEKLYYIKDYIMYVRQGDKEPEQMFFYDAQRVKRDIRIYSAVSVGGRIYGIATGNAFGKTGRIFTCDNKGYDFKYIGYATASNLVHVSEKGDHIYYMTSGNEPEMYVYDTECEDEFQISVVDKNNNSLLSGMSKFAVNDAGMFAIINNNTKIRYIEFERPAHECEWIKIYDDKQITDISAYAGSKFTEITAVNFDNKNNNLYAVDKTAVGNRVIKINSENLNVEVLDTFNKDIKSINLFDAVDGIKLIAIFEDGGMEYID